MNKMENIKETKGSYIIGLLKSYNIITAEIKNIKLILEEMTIDITDLDAIDYSRERSGATNKISRPTEIKGSKLADKTQAYKNILRKKEIEIEKLNNALESLPPDERDIIERYYIKDERMKDIAIDKNISKDYCGKLKKRGIKKIEELIY